MAWRSWLAGVVIGVSTIGLAVRLGGAVQEPSSVRGAPAPAHPRYSTLTQINKSNLDRLDIAWTYAPEDGQSYQFAPLVVDNVAYVLAQNNSLVALDAASGKERWAHEGLDGIAPRGINYWESADRGDRRLLVQRNNYLEALDARTGLPILSFGTDGAVNLREGLRRDPSTIVRVQSANPGQIFENLLILGSATGEMYMATPGDVRAFDVVTGRLVWQFHTIPLPGEFGYDSWPQDAYKYVGGANAWGEITVDRGRGIAFVPTGSPTYDFYGGDRHGANLFGTSLLALDARTGKRLWHFQVVHHDLFDYDNGAAPVLTTVRRDGRTIDVVALAGKTGFLYVFDRVTGEPLWPIEERKVPQSTVTGEQSWPTQPFPTNPPPFARQRFTAEDVNPYILTPAQRDTWTARIAAARNEGLFTPPAFGRDTVVMPGAQGGANLGATASHPTNGTVYVFSIDQPSIYNLSRAEPPAAEAGGAAASAADIARGRAIYAQGCVSCHGANLQGGGVAPTLVGITRRLSASAIRAKVTSGGAGMPATDLPAEELTALIGFLNQPGALAGSAAPPVPASRRATVVASGGTPGARAGGPFAPGPGGAAGPAYPGDSMPIAERFYSLHGMDGTIITPPFSTLTAYDLNTGTIKWQVPAGGDDPRALATGAPANIGYIQARSGFVSSAAGLLFQAGADGVLRVHDTETGRVLRTIPLPGGSRSIPTIYEAGDRQYLLVNATTTVASPPGAAPASARTGQRAYVALAIRD